MHPDTAPGWLLCALALVACTPDPAPFTCPEPSLEAELDGVEAPFALLSDGFVLHGDSWFSSWLQQDEENTVQLTLPADVTQGSYTTPQQGVGFTVSWWDGEQQAEAQDDFSYVIDQWGGPSGVARGTFSGSVVGDPDVPVQWSGTFCAPVAE